MNKLLFIPAHRSAFVFSFFLLLIVLQGCMQYYKVKTIKSIGVSELEKYIAENKYIILHQDSLARHLYNPRIMRNTLSGVLVDLPINHLRYKTTKYNQGNRYRNTKLNNESFVLNEVHLYLWNPVIREFGLVKEVEIPLAEISYADVYSEDKFETAISWGAIPVGLPVILLTGLIISLMNHPI